MYTRHLTKCFMLSLQSGIIAAKTAPSFSVELKDQRAAVGESAKFTCKFAGTPRPGRYINYNLPPPPHNEIWNELSNKWRTQNWIYFLEILWYHNNHLIKSKNAYKIDIDYDRYESTLTIVCASAESEGFYQCKAVNDISTNVTMAKFSLCSTSTMETTTTVTKTDEAKVLKEKTKKVKKIVKKKTENETARSGMNKTVEVAKAETKKSSASSSTSNTVKIVKTTNISESENVEIHEEIEEIRIKIYKELITEEDLKNFKIADEVNEILDMIEASKFGSGEMPLRELATIGYLVQRGITVNEVTHLYNADSFPALKYPESQAALVQLVERQGHGTLISEVMTEETVTDEKELAATVGFRAFMRMIEQSHITIEEVITNFKQEDFITHEWKHGEARERIVESEGSVCSREVLSTGKLME